MALGVGRKNTLHKQICHKAECRDHGMKCCSTTSDSFATSRTVARQAPLSMGFSRQEYWSGWPFSSPENLLDPGIKPGSPALQADSLLSEPPGTPYYGILSSTIMLFCKSKSWDFQGGPAVKSPPCNAGGHRFIP